VSPIDVASAEIRTFTVSTTDGDDIHLDAVQVAFLREGHRPTVDDWTDATFVSAAGNDYTFSIGFNLPGGIDLSQATGIGGPGVYIRWVKVTDNPEIPIFTADDTLTVTG
jgi:hypothetical protein